MVITTKDINLRKLFRVGQTVKIKKNSNPREKLNRKHIEESDVSVLRAGEKYKIIAIYRFLLLCLDSKGMKTCIDWGDLVMNGLIGCNTEAEEV